MSDRELFMYDVRVRERFLTEGTITKADVERRLAGLQDLQDQCEEVDLEQPALSKEPEEPAVPVLGEVPSVERLPAVMSGDAPLREVAPLSGGVPESTSSTPTVPTLPSGASAIPAIASEAAPPVQEPHGPASVPPPTASVDADWGDS